ncbi:hypothetical protein AVEN_242473-1 [Araneus ventricosus]|uniref:Receptor ligand binding region domain-containing protein n=1 Tax=Araneus ventricosus TaxID=182803 RepID=A0A4Y2NWH6_ARAVE|nr:hypothetical protein AVEN_242473-1 [Araneus ventricosus]
MHPLTTSVLVTILCTYLVEAELEPHRTVLNLSRFNYTIEKPVLDPSKPNVTLGFLTSFKDIEKLLIAGAVPLAVDMVNEDPELLPYHNLRFIAYDSGEADSALPLKKMTQMREEGVIGFIGLDGSCEHEALLAAAWDMAMVSYGPNLLVPARKPWPGGRVSDSEPEGFRFKTTTKNPRVHGSGTRSISRGPTSPCECDMEEWRTGCRLRMFLVTSQQFAMTGFSSN